MNRRFSVVSREPATYVALRTIEAGDLEDLRVWKNSNRAAFFFKGEILPAAQRAWFDGYLARPRDFMFLVESEGRRAGCMGFRIVEDAADAYNIMSAPPARGRGVMGKAMRLMSSYILAEHAPRVGCLVLKDNPAVEWYKKCGYRVRGEKEDHYEMELDRERFSPCAYELRPGG